MHHIKKGLDIPVSGVPQGTDFTPVAVRTVALSGEDYIDMRPTMLVEKGDAVKIGTPLFEDKKNPGVIFTSPGGGTVQAVRRGAKRALQAVVIALDASESKVDFGACSVAEIATLSTQQVREKLQKSGLWNALRTRPFNKTPRIDETPFALFVSVLDTQPLALDPTLVVDRHRDDFAVGLTILEKLTSGKVYVNHRAGWEPPLPASCERIKTQIFSGKHPAGLVGTQMHMLAPVGLQRVNWYLGYQDVIAFAKLFLDGFLWCDRYIALGGPSVIQPTLLRCRVGASIGELTVNRLQSGRNRIISGSILHGHQEQPQAGYLGRYHTQVSVIPEGDKRVLMRYLSPGLNAFSAHPIYLSRFFPAKHFPMSSNTMGSERAMVPICAYEQVMPLDILPTQLLRALIVEDIESAVDLGCLECDEEDLALCTFVCPGKYDYGAILRRNLTRIEKEL